MVVVINNNNRPVIIRETRQQIPCDGKFYTLPDDIARLYKDYLLVVPPAVVMYIEKMYKQIEVAKKELDNERKILEEEKKIYEPMFNKLTITNVKNESQWRAKVKRQTKYPKIDVLYSFHFNNDKDDAIKRFRASIKSIRKQNVRICVCVTSKDCIKKEIKDLGRIRYYHKYLDVGVYCKPKTINLGVEKLIKTPYFIHSDIDLIYPETYIQEIIKYTEYFIPVRVVFHNYNISMKYYGETFNDYKNFYNRHIDSSRSLGGIAPGNGLIHLETFKKINGYDEKYVGYGLEDADFNLRISYMNKNIILNNTNVNTYHLYHRNLINNNPLLMSLYKKNLEYFKDKRQILYEKLGTEDLNIFNEKHHLDFIMTNVGDSCE